MVSGPLGADNEVKSLKGGVLRALAKTVRDRWFPRPPAPVQFHGTYPFVNMLEMVIRHHLDITDVEFLQIGAADGNAEDPISDLVKTHVSDTTPAVDAALFEVKEAYSCGSVWADQTASMDREVVLDFLRYLSTLPEGAGLPDDLDEAIQETRVRVIDIAGLVDDLGTDRLDLLVIDVMGQDALLLASFPFDRIQPEVIMFEHSLMTNPQKQAVLNLLSGMGYAFVKFAVDTIAVKSTNVRQWLVTEW